MTDNHADVDALLRMEHTHGDDDWTPTPHGRHLARVLAENNVVEGREVLELGGGVGNHTIIMVRQGATRLVTTEITASRLETTKLNVEANCENSAVVEYREADWLNVEGDFDVIVSNPPFAQSGKRNRRYFIDELILNAHKRLREGGHLVFVQSSMADIQKTEQDLARNGYVTRTVESELIPFRDYYFADETFMEEIQHVPNGFEKEGEAYFERLYVVFAELQPWTQPATAHLP